MAPKDTRSEMNIEKRLNQIVSLLKDILSVIKLDKNLEEHVNNNKENI